MTNLDIILKSRDITLPTKVHLVKAMVFPVVMYGCESWTVKKAEHPGLISFRMDWLDLLAVPEKSSPTLQFKSISALVLSSLYGITLTSKLDYWANHSFDGNLLAK